MRFCNTINDLIDLLSDADAILELTDTNQLYVRFLEHKKENLHSYRPFIQGDRNSFKNKTKTTIASLVNSSEFWRKTTTVDQLANFAFACNDFGKLKIKKRANEPITIITETNEQAKKLFNAIEKGGVK